MKANVGTADRVFRVIFGTIILSTVVAGPQSMLGLIGLIPLATGLLGYCPLYRLVGFSSCPLAR